MSILLLEEALGAEGSIKTGPFGTVLQASEYSSEGVPMISVREIRQGFLAVTDETPRLRQETIDRLRDFVLQTNDVVFARKGGVERTAFVDASSNGWFLGSDGLRVRPSSRLDGRFLFFQMRTPRVRAWLKAHATGSTMPSLNQTILARIPVWVPALAEQRAIAEVLGALDDKIAANSKLCEVAQALMSAHTEQLPRSGTLHDLAQLSKRQIGPQELASLTVNHYSLPVFDAGQVPAVERGGDIKSGKFVISRPSVLLSKLNPRFPRVWDVPSPKPTSVASTEFLVLEPLELPTSAIWAALSSEQTVAYLRERAAGTSTSHQRVRPDEAMRLPMPTPGAFTPQLRELLGTLGTLVVSTREESQTLAALRDTLLPALMDGTIRVKDAISQAEGVL